MKRIFLLIIMFSMFASAVYAYECTVGDCQNGQGTLIFPDGNKFIGNFKNGKPSGQGVLILPEGKYVGQFENGFFHGQGTLIGPEGKYVGQFENGNYHIGTFTDPKGKILHSGRWHNNEPVKYSKTNTPREIRGTWYAKKVQMRTMDNKTLIDERKNINIKFATITANHVIIEGIHHEVTNIETKVIGKIFNVYIPSHHSKVLVFNIQSKNEAVVILEENNTILVFLLVK